MRSKWMIPNISNDTYRRRQLVADKAEALLTKQMVVSHWALHRTVTDPEQDTGEKNINTL